MVFRNLFRLIVASSLPLAALGQSAPKMAPVPSDPLELVTGEVRPVDSPAGREAIIHLLDRARDSYALRTAGRAYDLKVEFTVNSGGQTAYDGDWKMEDVFDPAQGLQWKAKAPGSYAITRIFSKGTFYGDETEDHIPLRLQEARAALFGPMPSAESVAHASIRVSKAIYKGAPLTCVLLSGPKGGIATPGRRWDETEECIDPQTGLLRTHSQVPGRYFAYKYSTASHFAGHVLPGKVIVTEGGKTVTEIVVKSLTELPAADAKLDAKLFTPTEEMKTKGHATEMAQAQKIWRFAGQGKPARGATIKPVCVFGLVTSSGQLVEAHSLQPSDPNSAVAVEDAKQINFSLPPFNPHPAQHFVFVIEKFVSSKQAKTGNVVSAPD
jgi:hypothetical protein